MSDTPDTSDDDYHHDPQLDRTLAVAIATMFTPASPRSICLHSNISRVRADPRCHHCHKVHMFGWVYRCEGCGYKACHNCCPRFLERSWDSIGGVLGEHESTS